MGPLTRFEKIEGERPPREAPAREEPARFLATETPGPASPTQPDEVADGALARLPTLACDVCGEESSKFASHCQGCGSRLDSPAARALNLERLARFDAAAEAERQASSVRHTAAPPQVRTPEPEPLLGPHGPATWPRWAQGLAVAGVAALLFPKLLVLAVPGVLLWLAWRIFIRPWR
jgi:hypothetical protein